MKISRLIVAVVFFNLFAITAQTYTSPDKIELSNITINLEDRTIKTQILNQAVKLHTSNDKTYLWYGSQKLMETRGGYSGKLVHGTYTVFYLNNQVQEKGFIRYGLKNREWKYWYPDGKLKEVITWKNGIKHGHYELYNDFGQLMARGSFKNDKLHGKFYTYGNAGTVLEMKRYKNGNEVAAKVKKTKEKHDKQGGSKKRNKQNQNTEEPAEKKVPLLKRLFKKKTKTEPAPNLTETRASVTS